MLYEYYLRNNETYLTNRICTDFIENKVCMVDS